MAESVETGFILMAAGMGTVFVLLAVLVGAVGLVSRLCAWIAPPAVPAAAGSPLAPPDAPDSQGEVLSVIGAAIKAHRGRHSAR